MVELLKPRFSPIFQKRFERLSSSLKKKFEKQFKLLINNPRHPSLRAKKMEGLDLFEARLDYHNRFVYRVINKEIWFYSIGPHDTGLGKK